MDTHGYSAMSSPPPLSSSPGPVNNIVCYNYIVYPSVLTPHAVENEFKIAEL